MRLYFIHMPGCSACEAAKPELAKWKRQNPGVEVIPVDLLKDGARWIHPWTPSATPTYVFEEPGRERVRYEGALTKARLDAFFIKAKTMMGVPA